MGEDRPITQCHKRGVVVSYGSADCSSGCGCRRVAKDGWLSAYHHLHAKLFSQRNQEADDRFSTAILCAIGGFYAKRYNGADKSADLLTELRNKGGSTFGESSHVRNARPLFMLRINHATKPVTVARLTRVWIIDATWTLAPAAATPVG